MDDNMSFYPQLLGKKKNLSDQIVDYITQEIIDGKLHPGDRLPTEEQYSAQFSVSKHAVREAIKVLIGLGVVEIRRADGTFVVNQYTKKLLNPVIYGMILNRQDIDNLLELNICFLREILPLAKQRMGPLDAERMEKRYQELCGLVLGSSEDVEQMTDISKQFYLELAELTKNVPMIQIYDAILDILKQIRKQGFEFVVKTGERAEWMNNYNIVLSYLRGESDDAEAICAEILNKWNLALK